MVVASIFVGLSAIAQLLLALAAGVFFVRRLSPRLGTLESVLYGSGFSLVALPTLSFLVAWALGRALDQVVVLPVAATLLIASRPWSLLRGWKLSRTEVIALAGFFATAVFLLLVTDFRWGEGPYFLNGCLQRSAFFLHEYRAPTDAGWVLYAPDVKEYLTYVLPHQDGPIFGFYYVIENQRPANGALVATFFSLTGRPGLELLTGLLYFLMAGGAYLVVKPLLPKERTRLPVAIVSALSAHGLVAYMMNESTFALVSGLLVLALLLREEFDLRLGALAGLFLAFAVGSRLAALSWVPAVILLQLSRKRAANASFWTSFVLFALPWFVVPWVLQGSPFYHPNPDETLVQHELLGLSFSFRPLNWPLFESFVRAPGNVLPAGLLVPILALRSAGGLIAGASLVGLVCLVRRRRKLALATLLWSAPTVGLLLLLVYVDDEKASWLLLAAPVAPLWLAGFVENFRLRSPAWPVALALAAGFTFLPRLLADADVPQDPREYELVDPDYQERSIHERYGEGWQEELSTPALVPGFHDVAARGHLLDTLAPSATIERFGPGRELLCLENVDGRVNASFPLATASVPPMPLAQTADTGFPTKPRSVTTAYQIVVRLQASDHVQLTVTGFLNETRDNVDRSEELRFELSTNDGPKTERFLSFLVLRPHELERPFEGIFLWIDDVEQPLEALGFEYTIGDEGEKRFFPSVIANAPFPPTDPVSRSWIDDGDEIHVRWTCRGLEGAELERPTGPPVKKLPPRVLAPHLFR